MDETEHLGKGEMMVGGEGELASGGHSAALGFLASLTGWVVATWRISEEGALSMVNVGACESLEGSVHMAVGHRELKVRGKSGLQMFTSKWKM